MAKTKVLGLCGSLRADSWNLKLLRNFLRTLEGGEFSSSLYGSLELPLMNEDLEKKPLLQSILDFRLLCPCHVVGLTGMHRPVHTNSNVCFAANH